MKSWLIGGAAVLGGAAIIADDIGSLVLGAVIAGGAVAASKLRKKDKVGV